jgi:hypothetical protein
MKELLSKKFWQDVKKTFDEAREETLSTPTETAVIPPPPEAAKPQDSEERAKPSAQPSEPAGTVSSEN